MEQLKHECGVAMIRLLKPIEYYKQKYGTYTYGLQKLYLLMEKQHNRGQEAAGVGVVKMHATPGHEYVFRERALGSSAIKEIFQGIYEKALPMIENAKEDACLADSDCLNPQTCSDEDAAKYIEQLVPFIGEIYMGHLRYSTTGKSGISYVHPFLRRNNWRSRNLLLCGNFNMTNVDTIFRSIVKRGQHPRIYSDTIVLLEQLGDALDKENHRQYRRFRDTLRDPELSMVIEDNIDLCNVLSATAPMWDGGYVICGATGSGDMFTLRDPKGIRPAFYYADDEIVVVASERPVIQTVLDAPAEQVHELNPGTALIVNKAGETSLHAILPEAENARCSFERIYFSRGSDSLIYNQRKQLGIQLVPDILRSVDYDFDHTVFSFIPNTAEVAFLGMHQGLRSALEKKVSEEILDLSTKGQLNAETLEPLMAKNVRVEKAVLKDIKLRTFITEGHERDNLAAHVYDITYGCVTPGVDNLVVIDDSIVRGTTLQQSILRMVSRLKPKKIVVVSSSPQVRYPDYYGIDMSRLSEFVAFRAAVSLIHKRGMDDLLEKVYTDAIEQLKLPADQQRNCVKDIYEPFTQDEISREICDLLVDPEEITAPVDIIYQTIEGLHSAVPDAPGDWYFSGNYPTPGGTRLINQAYVHYYEGNTDKRAE